MTSTQRFRVTVGGSGKDKQAVVSVFFTGECSARHQLRQPPANKYTLHQSKKKKKIHSCKIQSQALSIMMIANITVSGFSYILSIYDFSLCFVLTTEITLLLSEREQMHLSQPLSDKTIGMQLFWY